MPTWVIRADRRATSYEPLVAEIRDVAQSVAGLELRLVTQSAWNQAEPTPGFRDFSPIAWISHVDGEALQWAAEELVDSLGWRVDVSAESENVDA